jgi:hypothetical protein
VNGRRAAESPPMFATPSSLEAVLPPSSWRASASSSADALARVPAFFRTDDEAALAPARRAPARSDEELAAGPPASVPRVAAEGVAGDRAGTGCGLAGVERGADGGDPTGAGAEGGTAGASSGAAGVRGPVTLCTVPLTPPTI